MSRDALSKELFEELLQRARSGDARALDALFQYCQPRLDKWASRYSTPAQPGGARPSEFAQETALLAFREFSKFKGSTPGEWFVWLKQILRNHAAQSIRDSRRQKRDTRDTVSLHSQEFLETHSPQKSPSQVTSVKEEWRQLLVCVFELPDDQREAIHLCHLEELPVAEVARRMGKTEASVAGLLRRGWLKVEARMRQEVGPDAENTPGSTPRSDTTVALLSYLRRRELGEKVDPAAFVAEHPTCADELREMLHWIERLQALRPAPSKT